MLIQVKNLIDQKVIDATNKLGQQLLSSIALYTDASIGEVSEPRCSLLGVVIIVIIILLFLYYDCYYY